MAGKAGKVWSLPRFWVSIHSLHKKQPVKKFVGRMLDLVWLKFAVAALQLGMHYWTPNNQLSNVDQINIGLLFLRFKTN